MGSSFLAEMTSSLSSVISFSVENENTQKQLFESLDSISGTMGELSEFVAHIEGIGAEIELIALNARVKSGARGCRRRCPWDHSRSQYKAL